MNKFELTVILSALILFLSAGASAAWSQTLPAALAERGQQCQSGDAEACHNLGVAFAEGRGVSRNDEEAFRYHEIACGLEHLGSCEAVANAFFDSTGVQQNSLRAAQILRLICDRGSADYCAILGVYYAHGQNGLDDYDEGMILLDRACTASSALGCIWAQQALEIHGGEADEIRRYAHRHLSLIEADCHGPKPQACYALGDLYMNSEYIERAPAAARSAYQRGCSSGHELACTSLSRLLAR
ncbi:MAG: tetratricopeptide repeat protein [Maricaulis sp.]|nr:tetratricopeptide repeat protein [Maricaulis sp.]